MTFPKVLFGTCPICGGNGADDPNPPDGFADASDTVGNGIELITYKGQVMCKLCKKEIIADEEDELLTKRYNAEKDFLSKAGFKNSMEED